MGHNHWNGWVRTSSAGGSESLEQGVRITSAYNWAGTVVDFGSFAPTQIFVEAFAEFGVQVSREEARGPMGMGKWDHIRMLCDIPAIAERYKARFDRVPSDDDVTAIYKRFMPLQIEKIADINARLARGEMPQGN